MMNAMTGDSSQASPSEIDGKPIFRYTIDCLRPTTCHTEWILVLNDSRPRSTSSSPSCTPVQCEGAHCPSRTRRLPIGMTSVSHISDSDPPKSSSLHLALRDNTTSPADAASVRRLYGKPRARPERTDRDTESRETIEAPATTPEADLEAMQVDETPASPSPIDHVGVASMTDLSHDDTISPSKSSDFGACDLEAMRRQMGLGREIRELDQDMADERAEDLVDLFAKSPSPAPRSHEPTPKLSESVQTHKSSSSPRSPAEDVVRIRSKKRRRAILAESDSDGDSSQTNTEKAASTEPIVEDLSSSPRQGRSRQSTTEHVGHQKQKQLELIRQVSSSGDEMPTTSKKTKLKSLPKSELEQTKREAAALQRSRPARMEYYKANLSMADFLNEASSGIKGPEQPLSVRTARMSMPQSSTVRSATNGPKNTTPMSIPLEGLAHQTDLGDSDDYGYLETQTAPPPIKKGTNRTFLETDPIESTSQIVPVRALSLNSENDDLPDANDPIERIRDDKAKQAQTDEKAARLRKAKELALSNAATFKRTDRSRGLHLESSDDEFEVEAALVVPSAVAALARHQQRDTKAPAGKRDVQRTESQLVRAGQAFGITKPAETVTHDQLNLNLLAKSRLAAQRARERKVAEYKAAGGRLRDDVLTAPVETASDEPDIGKLLEEKRADAAAAHDDIDEDEDDDFVPPDDEKDDFDVGSEMEDDDEEVSEDFDEYGSADEESFAIRPDSPRKNCVEQLPMPLPSSPSARSSEDAEDANKENSFTDMRPLARLDDRRHALQARSALSQLSGETEPASPTQIVGAAAVAVPFHPGSPVDFGDNGFSQLFEEAERGDGPNVFDLRPEGAFLPTQMQHPGRALLPAFEGNAVLDDLVNSQLERQGPMRVIEGTPEARGPRQWLNAEGLLTQHRPRDLFEQMPEPSPDPFFKNRQDSIASLRSPGDNQSETQSLPSRKHPTPSVTAPSESQSISPFETRTRKRILESDDEGDADIEAGIEDDADDDDRDDDDLPSAAAQDQHEEAPATDAFSRLMAGAQRQRFRKDRAEHDAKRRKAAAFFDEQAERSDDDEGRGDRYGAGLMGVGSEDENYEGDSDDASVLEELVDDEKVAPELEAEQDKLAEERHKQHVAEDEARAQKQAEKVAHGHRRRKGFANEYLSESDWTDDELATMHRPAKERKRKDDDGTMTSIAANPETAAFAAGYIETFDSKERVEVYAFLTADTAEAPPSDDEDDVPIRVMKPVRTISTKSTRISKASVHAARQEPLLIERSGYRAFASSDEDELETQRILGARRTVPNSVNVVGGHADVSSLYFKTKTRKMTAEQRKEALEDTSNTCGDGRRVGAGTAVTSFKRRPQKSASMPIPGKSGAVTGLAKTNVHASVAPTRSLSSFVGKARFG